MSCELTQSSGQGPAEAALVAAPLNSVPCSRAMNSPTGSASAPKCSWVMVLRGKQPVAHLINMLASVKRTKVYENPRGLKSASACQQRSKQRGGPSVHELPAASVSFWSVLIIKTRKKRLALAQR